MDTEPHRQQDPATGAGFGLGHLALVLTCFLALATYGLLIDRKGINTDEGLRLAIINGGAGFTLEAPASPPTWSQVLAANSHHAYQPLYFLIQNTLMRVAGTHDVVFFRMVNVLFLWVCLQGLITLSKTWRLTPRLFLLGLFSFNAYLFMHVLQIREYIAGVAFYIWSTWLVLRLERRPLDQPWSDGAWFAGYGVLLTLGFYLQTWVVFPALGQGLFLIIRRWSDRGRFSLRLSLSYAIVLAATLPYLLTHTQKVDVGRWGTESSRLWPQLSDGFHLVLTGHLSNHSGFTDFLFWFWLAVPAGATLLFFRRKSVDAVPHGDFRREAVLMVLCSALPLFFQVGYFLAVENLAVWPRYFIVHYFFLTWLIALGFKYLHDLRLEPDLSTGLRRGLTAVTGIIVAMLVMSAVLQARSYHQNPYLDTGFTHASNWRVWTRELARVVQPDDVVLSYNFISRATMTFTRPMTNRVLLLQELEAADLQRVDRLVYMESSWSLHERKELVTRVGALGYITLQEVKMHSADGNTVLPEWQILIFTR